MKDGVIIVNVARGAVWDESAITEAVKSGKIGGMGCDVFTKEPFDKDHPFNEIMDYPNVLLTPHNAWGAYEARERLLLDIVENIKVFAEGGKRCRVDI